MKRTMLVLGLVVAVGCAIASVIYVKQQAARETEARELARLKTERAAELARTTSPTQPVETVGTAPAAAPKPPVQMGGRERSRPAPATSAPNAPQQPQDVVTDPIARQALGLVGVDPDAEEYWAASIFDTNLPDQEREDLMEDLNEEGLSDPRHPTSDDMVVIWNRLSAIERVLPYTDDFMQEHLLEAYKDLVGLLNGQSPQ